MKTLHKPVSIDEIERKQMDRDPLAKLNKSLTKRLDNFFSMSAEDDDSVFQATRNPEYQAVEKFLSHA
jgi:hypothetical protein